MISLSVARARAASGAVVGLRERAFVAGLAAIMLLALVLRLWSIDFGLPLVTHPDEPLIVDAAERMTAGRTLDSGWYRYPAFIIDLEAGVLVARKLVDVALGLDADDERTFAYTGGRTLMAGFGVATVLLTGLLARRVLRAAWPAAGVGLADVAGLVAALLLAASYLHVKDAHYLKPDVPTAFFTALTLWLTISAWQRGNLAARAWLLPGLAGGLAAATKYNGGVVLIVPAVALLLLGWRAAATHVSAGQFTVFLRTARWTLGALWWPELALAGATGLAFLIVNPAALLHPHAFIWSVDGVRAEWQHYHTGHDGAEGSDTWRWYLAEVWRSGFGPTLTPLVLLGALTVFWLLVRSAWGDRGSTRVATDERDGDRVVPMLVLLFVPCYYVLIAPFPVRFDRQLIPVLPFLAVLGGCGVVLAGNGLRAWIAGRSVRTTPLSGPAVALGTLVVVGLLAVPQVGRSLDLDRQIGQRDTRYAALDWIETNVPTSTRIAREWHTPPLAQAGYDEVPVRKLDDHPLEWYEAAGAEVIVLSSFMYQRYLDDPAHYPREAAFYAALLSQPRLATFEGDNGPVIVILRREDAAPAFQALRLAP